MGKMHVRGLGVFSLEKKGDAMTPDEMKRRTFQFALSVIKAVSQFRRCCEADVISKQLIRSGTSVGANYRSACCARSTADFISKMTIVEEEADESVYWMELAVSASVIPPALLAPLIQEGREITAITKQSAITARGGTRASAKIHHQYGS